MLKSITSSPQAQKALQVAKDVGPTVLALGTTGTGLWYVGAVEPVLTYVDSFFSPLIGSLAANVYAQGVALVAEAGLAVAALRTGTWTVGQVRKAGKLEAENLQLKADIKEAHEAIEEMENGQDNHLAAREEALAKKEKELAKKEASLNRKEANLEKAKEKIQSQRSAIKTEEANLARDKAALTQERQKAQTKNHDAAKNLKERETELLDRERAAEDLQSELEQAKLVLDEERAELAEQKAAFERSKQQTARVIPVPLAELATGIKVRPSLLTDFARRKELDKQQRAGTTIMHPGTVQESSAEEGELSSASSPEDNSTGARRRTPRPTGLH